MSMEDFAAHFAEFDWPWYMPSVEEYSALVDASEMVDGLVWGENADRYFPDTEAMIKWVDQPSLVPFLARVSDRDKTAFREYVVKRMIEKTLQNDGKCFETFRRINLSARK
jgi:trans-aconitate methyltransferase